MIRKETKKEIENYSKEYQLFLTDKKIELTRLMCVLSAILFLAFVIVDFWAIPSAVINTSIIRGGVIFFLGLTYFLTYTNFFPRYYTLIVAGTYLVATLAVEAMIYLSVPADQAYETYFVGVILIIITLFSWTYLQLSVSIPLALFSVLAYTYIEIFVRDFTLTERLPALLTNVFLLVSASVIGFAAQVLRDRYLRENFYLQRSLEKALEEKTEEAKDNAYQANHDVLTGLPNRRYITELLEVSLEKAKERNKVLAFLFLDLNGFKQVNDIYGHAVGDEVLKIVAKRLELAIREGDYLSRLGGDEYLISLMLDQENLTEVENLAEKFTALILQPMNIDGQIIKIGASIGISAFPVHGNNVRVLMGIADKKMYQIKHGKTDKEEKMDEEEKPVLIFPGNKKRR